jgi:hypothetical protein
MPALRASTEYLLTLPPTLFRKAVRIQLSHISKLHHTVLFRKQDVNQMYCQLRSDLVTDHNRTDTQKAGCSNYAMWLAPGRAALSLVCHFNTKYPNTCHFFPAPSTSISHQIILAGSSSKRCCGCEEEESLPLRCLRSALALVRKNGSGKFVFLRFVHCETTSALLRFSSSLFSQLSPFHMIKCRPLYS